MFATFFQELKQAGVPVTLREYLTLMEAMDKDLAGRRIEDFYYLSRATLVRTSAISTASTASSATCSKASTSSKRR